MKIKYIGFLIFLSMLSSTTFGQQILWSTTNDTLSNKHISLDNVTKEVLEFYDHYEYYYDWAGFSKDGFIKSFEGSKSYKNSSTSKWSNFKKLLYGINQLTVFAFRTNSGEGSSVSIMCITKENVNMLVFSNTLEKNFNITYDSKRDDFSKWFKTLLE